MTPLLALAAGATLGAASGFHCIAMCGPLAAATCGKSARTSTEYLGGRLLGYSIVGAIAGVVGAPIATGASGGVLRVMVALLVAGVLVYRGLSWVRPELITLRKKPRASYFDRLLPLLPRRGLGLGLATAIFPCGALLGGIVAAAASGTATLGALLMAAFAIGSAPLLMIPSLLGPRLSDKLRSGTGRRVAGMALLAVAAWVVAVPIFALASQPSKPACCQHHHG
ncbi:MAG: sulfite exporter TauE/SafE family protein [Polyangiales bacterium]